jgi:outer membrane immunogenic protein
MLFGGMKMKKLLLALMLSTSPIVAYAADMVSQEPEALPVEPLLWSGAYLGLHAGYAWGRENDNQSDLFSSVFGPPGGGTGSADRFDLDGFIGGLHAGYNWQTGPWVFGVEGDIDYADLSGGADFFYPLGRTEGHLSFESDWQASLRLRAGYAVDTWLFYATGGAALGHGELHARGSSFGQPVSVSDDNTHTGWTVGAGVEKAFTPNWIGRFEVRYTDFGKESYDLGLAGNDIDVDWNQTAINIGLSYKF